MNTEKEYVDVMDVIYHISNEVQEYKNNGVINEDNENSIALTFIDGIDCAVRLMLECKRYNLVPTTCKKCIHKRLDYENPYRFYCDILDIELPDEFYCGFAECIDG